MNNDENIFKANCGITDSTSILKAYNLCIFLVLIDVSDAKIFSYTETGRFAVNLECDCFSRY